MFFHEHQQKEDLILFPIRV